MHQCVATLAATVGTQLAQCAVVCCNPCSWCSHLVWCAWVCSRVTSTFGVACIGVLQGLHQHLVWRAQACCKGYINIWCSVHGCVVQGLHPQLVQCARVWHALACCNCCSDDFKACSGVLQ